MELVESLPPQPSTERARRCALSAASSSSSSSSTSGLYAYASNKIVVVRQWTSRACVCTFGGHQHPVTAVAFSSDGRFVASGDSSGAVKIWSPKPFDYAESQSMKDIQSTESVECKYSYQLLAGKVNGLSFCSENSRLIAVGSGSSVRACAVLVDSGNSIGEISGHSSEINAVAMRPVRPLRAVTVGEDGNVVFHEGAPFKFVHSKQLHQNAVSDVKYSPNGEFLVTAGWDRKVCLFDGGSGEFLEELKVEHEGMILSVSFLSDDLLLTASTDRTVRLFDLKQKKTVKSYSVLGEGVGAQIVGVQAVSASQFVAVTLNGDIHAFDRENDANDANEAKIIQGHQGAVSALSVKPVLLSASIDGSVVEWSSSDKQKKEKVHEGPVCSLIGNPVFSVGWDRKIAEVEGSRSFLSEEQPVQAVQAAQAGSEEDGIYVVSEFAVEKVGSKSVAVENGLCIDATNEYVVVGCGNETKVFSPDLEQKHVFPARLAQVSAVQISPDNQLLAVGDASGKITLYKLADFSVVTSKWAFHTSKVTSIKWNSDSTYVLTCGLDTNVYIYSVKRPIRHTKLLGAHKDGVLAVQWSDSDKPEEFVYSAGADGVIRKWITRLP